MFDVAQDDRSVEEGLAPPEVQDALADPLQAGDAAQQTSAGGDVPAEPSGMDGFLAGFRGAFGAFGASDGAPSGEADQGTEQFQVASGALGTASAQTSTTFTYKLGSGEVGRKVSTEMKLAQSPPIPIGTTPFVLTFALILSRESEDTIGTRAPVSGTSLAVGVTGTAMISLGNESLASVGVGADLEAKGNVALRFLAKKAPTNGQKTGSPLSHLTWEADVAGLALAGKLKAAASLRQLKGEVELFDFPIGKVAGFKLSPAGMTGQPGFVPSPELLELARALNQDLPGMAQKEIGETSPGELAKKTPEWCAQRILYLTGYLQQSAGYSVDSARAVAKLMQANMAGSKRAVILDCALHMAMQKRRGQHLIRTEGLAVHPAQRAMMEMSGASITGIGKVERRQLVDILRQNLKGPAAASLEGIPNRVHQVAAGQGIVSPR